MQGCINKTITHPVADTFFGTGTENRKWKNGELLQDLLHTPKRGKVGGRGKAANESNAPEVKENRTKRSPRSNICRTSRPITAQRVRRGTREVLNLTGIQTVPTPLKRGPSTPSSAAEDTSSSSGHPHRKTSELCAKGSYPTLVRAHSTDKSSKKKWTVKSKTD